MRAHCLQHVPFVGWDLDPKESMLSAADSNYAAINVLMTDLLDYLKNS